MISDIQKSEFIAAETLLLDRLSKINPLIKTFVLQSPKVRDTIDNVEGAILLCMKENGMVDGKCLGGLLTEKFPDVCQWINVPSSEFRLSDEINKILKLFVGG